jgi:hypothetical protein
MTGHHIVRLHNVTVKTRALHLPSGWKPFGGIVVDDTAFILTREWIKDEKEKNARH